ncbi:DUF421 domain-containing protein [Natribacillus halophilus]|uniref:Uncharacterized membrane protein YcaP, DUF421 family n=1 Tax=Natribacillus halophilus TaxID=549003 RepID=A0A1G8J5D1_9BACI|nr:YetF domain-containing protein [Natribacillus halophilus]SDI26459.1 Uncharacterized membrane protein YcaP, DUF421 family [Natribacillus halophilus]
MELFLQAVIIYVGGTTILRISGRRSISQMTIPQTAIMIGIGSLMIQPLTGNGTWWTLAIAFVLILCLIATEILQIKFNRAENVISGKAVPVIENGTLHEKNLKKLLLPVDKLEARLREAGIASMEDVEMATIESSGQLGYTLKPGKQPATKEDIQNLVQLVQNGQSTNANTQETMQNDIFTETENKEPGNTTNIPGKLQ